MEKIVLLIFDIESYSTELPTEGLSLYKLVKDLVKTSTRFILLFFTRYFNSNIHYM